MESQNTRRDTLGDGLAVSLSAICLAHCLLPSILAGTLPLLGSFIHAPWVHALLLACAAPLSLFVLVKGYRRHHQLLPCVIGGIGLILLAVGMVHIAELPIELAASVAGALLLVVAHGQNMWLRVKQKA